MAPSHSRQLLVWSLPTIAVLLSYFWFKKKRLGQQSDTCDNNKNQKLVNENKTSCDNLKKTKEEDIPNSNQTPSRLFSRSLSGVDSAPIDIVIPHDMRASKSSQIVISDEDLDFEIEKIKSMRNFEKPKSKTINKTLSSPAKIGFETNTVENRNKVEEIKNDLEKKQEKQESKPIETQQEVAVITNQDSPVEVKEEPVSETCQKEKVENIALANPTPPKKTEIDTVDNKTQSKPTPKGKKIFNKMKDQTKTNTKNNNSNAIKAEQVEEKFASMKISSNRKASARKSRNKTRMDENAKNTQNKSEKQEVQRKSSERDSANHSPAEIMLASPSLSNISDNGSSDSGKGGSDVATPPSYRIPTGEEMMRSNTNDQLVVHEFEVPNELVGRLIGKKGAFVTQIKVKTNADVIVKAYPLPNANCQVCVVEGMPKEVEAALKMIRRKFPLETNPELTLQPLSGNPVQLLPDKLYLKLVEGINNDTTICCVESATHLFVQFPTHPTFPNLVILHNCMQMCYNMESPELPNPVPVGAICAARSKDSWYRAQIVSTDSDSSYIKFLDWGGYQVVQNSDLRKIRYDFTLLPFQAAECILANIQPAGGEDSELQDEAIEYIEHISRGALVYTQVADYTPEGIPLVLCFINVGSQQVINLNSDLVEKGFAEWIPNESEGEVVETASM